LPAFTQGELEAFPGSTACQTCIKAVTHAPIAWKSVVWSKSVAFEIHFLHVIVIQEGITC
jgi:hypothetical protein